MKKIYLWLLLPLSIFGGCESLEDTYKDYAGDGPIRYLVKCDDLDVKAGWNRLVVSWKSVDDPIIDKVKVPWTVDGIGRDTLLERGTFACSLYYIIFVCIIGTAGASWLGIFGDLLS